MPFLGQALVSLKPAIDEIEEYTQVTLTDVPVFDEETTVKNVVEVLLANNQIDEVICVNDGASDNSLAILETFGEHITLIDLKQNQGKGYTLALAA